nr:MAG TPA: hypothetical protein [Caudoviricetes sp.]
MNFAKGKFKSGRPKAEKRAKTQTLRLLSLPNVRLKPIRKWLSYG